MKYIEILLKYVVNETKAEDTVAVLETVSRNIAGAEPKTQQ